MNRSFKSYTLPDIEIKKIPKRADNRSIKKAQELKERKRVLERKIEDPFSKLKKTAFCLMSVVLGMAILSYYMVVEEERKLASLNKETTEIGLENVDIQSKIDKMKSFNEVETKVYQKASFLNKPKEVLEVKNLEPKIEVSKNNTAEIIPEKGY